MKNSEVRAVYEECLRSAESSLKAALAVAEANWSPNDEATKEAKRLLEAVSVRVEEVKDMPPYA